MCSVTSSLDWTTYYVLATSFICIIMIAPLSNINYVNNYAHLLISYPYVSHGSGPIVEFHCSGPLVEFHGSGPLVEFHCSGTLVEFHGSGPLVEFHCSGTLVEFHGSGPLVEFRVLKILHCHHKQTTSQG